MAGGESAVQSCSVMGNAVRSGCRAARMTAVVARHPRRAAGPGWLPEVAGEPFLEEEPIWSAHIYPG